MAATPDKMNSTRMAHTKQRRLYFKCEWLFKDASLTKLIQSMDSTLEQLFSTWGSITRKFSGHQYLLELLWYDYMDL